LLLYRVLSFSLPRFAECQASKLTSEKTELRYHTSQAWDDECGGIFYGFAPDGTICDSDK
jgi:hypothetical protein